MLKAAEVARAEEPVVAQAPELVEPELVAPSWWRRSRSWWLGSRTWWRRGSSSHYNRPRCSEQ
jgi:hypothetical protein